MNFRGTKQDEASGINIVAGVALLCFVGVLSVRSQDSQQKTHAVHHRRQFVLDVLDRKVDANSNHAWVVARLISEKLETNRAFQAFLLNEPRRVFDALPSKPFRSSDAPLLWDKAMVEVRRIGTGGAEVGVRVLSKDGADVLAFITAGGTHQHLKKIENVNHRCSLEETPERSAATSAQPPIANAVAEKIATNLFWKITAHYGYRPVELLPPTISITNQFLVTLNSESGKEVVQNARVPCWTATFYSRTNFTVQGSGQANDLPGATGFFTFAFDKNNKSWKPTVIDLAMCPRVDASRPLIELADMFLEKDWADNIYDVFTTDPAKVANEVTERYQENPYLHRTLQNAQ